MCEYLGGKPGCVMKVNLVGWWRASAAHLHHRPVWISLIDLSKSILVGTRKMVNYA